MVHCELCNSTDVVRAKVKRSSIFIAICRECGSVYEVDENLMPVLGHDPNDSAYFDRLETLFRTWDELTDIIPYDKEKEETEWNG